MKTKLRIYNSYSRQKEVFEPLKSPFVGMYVCGPTVYGYPHIGHARAAIVFDVLFRYLQHLQYKVRYVRNITDVGHLVNDADEGEDKIQKKAQIEQLEPMEIVQKYTNSYHDMLLKINCLPPSIEPSAIGHILEQQEMVQKILDKGFAYQSDGNVYFDVKKYASINEYGKLSGKVLEDMLSNTRELQGQEHKKNSVDFALWKKAEPEHIMSWNSQWSKGFPGWHLECSVMSSKYLGLPFDIHGGGLDLMFPHHESEIAQVKAAYGVETAKYWVHNNMITINGQKMSKSVGNFITLNELFGGNHQLLEQAYTPMTLRFFILQAHYRSTLDFSNSALKAAQKGYEKLISNISLLDEILGSEKSNYDINIWITRCYEVINDDINTAKLIAELFEAAKIIKNLKDGKIKLDQKDLEIFKQQIHVFAFDILGLKNCEESSNDSNQNNKIESLMELLLELRQNARKNKDFRTSDIIRDQLKEIGFEIKDTPDGTQWNIK